MTGLSPLQKFDSTAAIASLSMCINDLQRIIGSLQGSIQELGMALGQSMQAQNMIAKRLENAESQLKSLTGTSVVNGTECTQNGSPC